jgi:alkylhydroperoxidase family enzyme
MSLLETVAPENAEGDVEKAYSFFTNNGIPIPKPFELMSVSPELLKIQSQLLEYYSKHPTLGFPLLTMIRFLVAKEFNYAFCTDFNRNFLKMQGMEDGEIEETISAPDTAPLEDKDKALLVFVLKSIKTPDAVSAEEVDALHELGWTDRDILDATVHGTGMIGPSFLLKAFKMDSC